MGYSTADSTNAQAGTVTHNTITDWLNFDHDLKLTTADSLILINHYKNILDAEGIPSEIRNQHLSSILGEMPFAETWPELWVRNDIDFDRAKQLIDDSIADESPAHDWRCPASLTAVGDRLFPFEPPVCNDGGINGPSTAIPCSAEIIFGIKSALGICIRSVGKS